jgi:SAM-dependent methyltransferase
LAGLDAIELGCGTAYVSAWLMRRGARVIGLDNSSNQLATARLLQEEFSLRFPLVHADAERPPFADANFDFVISQYGAATWCDPFRWIPEASRILRGGGRLVFETGSPLVMCCYPTDDDDAPADSRLHRDYFGMHRFPDRSLDEQDPLVHACTSCTSPAARSRVRPVASRNTSSSVGSSVRPRRCRRSALSSAGVPSATIRPPSMIASRSQSWSASSRHWVVRKIVVPCR